MFNQEKYNKYDPSVNPDVAEAMDKAFALFGFTAIEQRSEDFGADWCGNYEEKDCLMESQVKAGWKQGRFPYNTIAVFMRYGNKPHTQLKAMKEKKVYHLMMDENLNRAILLDWEHIKLYAGRCFLPSDRGYEENYEMGKYWALECNITTGEVWSNDK